MSTLTSRLRPFKFINKEEDSLTFGFTNSNTNEKKNNKDRRIGFGIVNEKKEEENWV